MRRKSDERLHLGLVDAVSGAVVDLVQQLGHTFVVQLRQLQPSSVENFTSTITLFNDYNTSKTPPF